MQLGIFAKIFDRPNVSSCLQVVADAGIPATQFNLSVAGLPTIPDEPVPDDVVDAIRASANQAGVALAAISGTFNAAHPDPAHRQTYLARSPHLCVVARDLQIGIVVVTRPRRLRWRARTYPHPQHDGGTTELEQISSGTAIAARARALIAAGTPTSLANSHRHHRRRQSPDWSKPSSAATPAPAAQQ